MTPVVSIAGGIRLRGVVAVVVSAAVAATSAHTWAADEDVEAIVKHGVELRKEGKDREALAEFQRAAQIDRTPRVVGQIGLAEVAMGIWPAAQEHLEEALEHHRDPWVSKNYMVLEKTLATVETHLGSLEIWGTPPGAEIVVDGKSVGTLPLAKPVHVVAGMVTVMLQAKGYQSVGRTLQVVSQQLTRENIDLSPLPQPAFDRAGKESAPSLARAPVDLAVKETPPVTVPSRPLDRPTNGGTLVGQSVPPVAPAPTESRPLVRRWWFWTVVGIVLVGGVVGAMSLIQGRDQSPDCLTGITCSPH